MSDTARRWTLIAAVLGSSIVFLDATVVNVALPAIAPLHAPAGPVSSAVAEAARAQSTDAIHLAMLVSAGLLIAGAAVNGLGIRNTKGAGSES